MALLEVRHLSRSFGGLAAVHDVSFDVVPGCIKGIIGPNGAGKTTLFNLVCGATRADSGSVVLEGEQTEGLPPFAIAARGMLRTFQQVRLFHGMTVLENVMTGMHTRASSGMLAALLGSARVRDEESVMQARARECLSLTGVEAYADCEATSLAFGQQRGVELARALAAQPRIVLLDEPAAGLNMHETAELAALIRTIRDRGVTVVLVEHDMSLVMDVCDEVVVLSSGKKIAEGTPRQIQGNEEVVRVYLGDECAENP